MEEEIQEVGGQRSAVSSHQRSFSTRPPATGHRQPILITIILSFLIFQSAILTVLADEGMWIPGLLSKYTLEQMQKKGFRLTAEDLYSINQASLKDAVVLFGRGCTGAIVSGEGLLLTNHHCGYGRIQAHSSIEHDYLTDGFWAMSKEEELPNPGLTVSILLRMEDVTDRVMKDIKEGMAEEQRDKVIEEAAKIIVEEAVKDTHYDAEVKPLYNGNQFFLYVTEVFKDVRLVGAPPSSIGKFGGDTDNWMWPRHTGDFSIFRIYADSANKPAVFSKNNVPYRPKKFLAISVEGVDKGDFTMVYGYPASTSEYLPSFMVEMIKDVSDPKKIEIRQKKLDIIEAEMAADPLVRIQYANKQAGIANAWKKWIGVDIGLERFNAVEKKQAFEKEFQFWANDYDGRKYKTLLSSYSSLLDELKPIQYWADNYFEAIWQTDIIRYAGGFRLLAGLEKDKPEDLKKEVDRLKAGAAIFFKDYNSEVDKKIFITMLSYFRQSVKPEEHPEIYKLIDDKFDGDIEAFAGWAYSRSFLVSEEKVVDFLESYKFSDSKLIEKDPVFMVMKSFRRMYENQYAGKYERLMVRMDSLQRLYMEAIMEMQPEKQFYPDANSSLRLSYGIVNDYHPRDAVCHDYQTTLSGILEKEDPDICDYQVSDRLKELYRSKDYGPYGQDGEMYVCFTAANHTTGGNSGSPVLNAGGELIGLNFDRNWEGTMSDIMYDPQVCRNIVLDIRYCLFIIDKYAGAGHLVKEMEIRGLE